MKMISVAIAFLLLSTLAQADQLKQTFTGKLRGSNVKDVHVLDLNRGQYRYELALSGDKRARAKIKITKRRLSGTSKTLLVAKKLKSRHTHEGTFPVEVRGVAGQNTNGTRQVKFIVSKKIGPREVRYVLKVYKK